MHPNRQRFLASFTPSIGLSASPCLSEQSSTRGAHRKSTLLLSLEQGSLYLPSYAQLCTSRESDFSFMGIQIHTLHHRPTIFCSPSNPAPSGTAKLLCSFSESASRCFSALKA